VVSDATCLYSVFIVSFILVICSLLFIHFYSNFICSPVSFYLECFTLYLFLCALFPSVYLTVCFSQTGSYSVVKWCKTLLLLCPSSSAEYCDQPVCLSVCPQEYISGTAGPIGTKFCMWIPCGCDSVLLWQCCNMLCTSSFMDDVTFVRSGPYGIAWPAWAATSCQLCAWPWQSLMSMNVCLFSVVS